MFIVEMRDSYEEQIVVSEAGVVWMLEQARCEANVHGIEVIVEKG